MPRFQGYPVSAFQMKIEYFEEDFVWGYCTSIVTCPRTMGTSLRGMFPKMD